MACSYWLATTDKQIPHNDGMAQTSEDDIASNLEVLTWDARSGADMALWPHGADVAYTLQG